MLSVKNMTVFTRLNAPAFNFFSGFERGVYSRAAFHEGGVFLKLNLFLANSSMVRVLKVQAIEVYALRTKNIVINESKFPKLV